jgi:endonuclease III-like uncharacterized protein
MNPMTHKTPEEKIEEIADLLAELKVVFSHDYWLPNNHDQYFVGIEKIITDNGSNQQIMTRAMNNYKKKQLQDKITKLQQELDQLDQ